MIMIKAPAALPPAPKWRHPNELMAYAIQQRNSGQNAVMTLSGGYIGLHDWLDKEAKDAGFDPRDMGTR